MDPLALLQEDLKDDDQEEAVAGVNRLPIIAMALGPARTRSELIPFLREYSDTDNDEAQTAIATHLGDFSELVGGATHVPVLLPLLEKLCGEEECVVRNAAADSLAKLSTHLNKADVPVKFVPVIRRLTNGDWFTTRVSACKIFTCIYPLVGESVQDELKTLFIDLCKDDTPMVRRAAFENLVCLIAVMSKTTLKNDIIPVVRGISEDDSDDMRVLSIDCCVALLNHPEINEFLSLVFAICESLFDDASWKVRRALATQCPQLIEAMTETTSAKRMVAVYAGLLKDKDAEVRIEAAGALKESVPKIRATDDAAATLGDASKGSLNELIVPTLDGLTVDPDQRVRVAFSKSLSALCESLGKEASTRILVPIMSQMCKDEAFEVRSNMIEHTELLGDAMGAQGLTTTLVPALLELSKDPKWRVREAVIKQSALLAKHLGQKTFEKKTQSMVVASLSDHVYAIREQCCSQVGLVVKEFGCKWAGEKLFPVAFTIYDKTTNYLHRMTCLSVISHCAAHCNSETIEKFFLPLILQSCVDDVANVRLQAARSAEEIVTNLDASIVDVKLKPALERLTSDSDIDVEYFSQRALKKIDAPKG